MIHRNRLRHVGVSSLLLSTDRVVVATNSFARSLYKCVVVSDRRHV